MKKILRYLIFLLPWFIGSLLFPNDSLFYKSLNKPTFAPPGYLFAIIWPILYILIALSIYKMKDKNKNYLKALIINYFSNQIFSFFFFTIKSPFIAMIDTIIVLISSLYLYLEAKKDNSLSAKLLIPYILWNIFATYLIISVYIMNI
ncbi:MAG: tryptophan-rich sensory protein [Bacilli bacterium]|nr:tryptophan-rich sensory protein [Bacilli bacterium]